MHEVLGADGAKLSHREESSDRNRPERLVDRFEVVIRDVEEPAPATVATKQEPPNERSRLNPFVLDLKKQSQIFVGGGGVSDVKLDRLTDANQVRDRDSPRFIRSLDVSDQEISTMEALLVFIDHPSNMQALAGEILILRCKFLKNFLKHFQ